MQKDRVILALDFPSAQQAIDVAEKLRGEVGALKVGFELFVSAGPDLVKKFVEMGHKVFLDLKLHDIPYTVHQAVRAATRLGVWMINIHAIGGPAMMAAALAASREEAASLGTTPPKIIAVTILTSMDDMDLAAIGLKETAHKEALNLAQLAKTTGLDGVVCSARDAASILEYFGEDFLRVTPGIRPEWAQKNDQKRVMTPTEALAAGASHLVIGRPITQAPDPIMAARTIFE